MPVAAGNPGWMKCGLMFRVNPGTRGTVTLMDVIRKDVIVVGLGAFGSAALWRLAERGAAVAGIERYGIGHNLGSSHGLTRLFRVACQEHPGLPPIARKSLELWTELGGRTGESLVLQAGCLSVGAPDSRPVKGTLAAAAAAGLPVSQIGARELELRQPQYAGLGDGDVGVWDPGGGICFPERNVRAQVEAARQAGAEIYPNTMALSIEAGPEGVTVLTAAAEFRAAQVVVAAGAWLGKLVPGLPLAPRRTPQYWFRPWNPASDDFTLARFPAFIWQRPDGDHLWGHGSDDGFEVKIGLGGLPRPSVDPDKIDRYIHPDTDIDPIAASLARAFPGLDPRPSKVITCMVTHSPDSQFIIGRLNSDSPVVVAGGDSGHGFKHAAGVGEMLAQMVVGEQPYCDTSFLNPARFG
jgi:sarcosine oxidase